MKKLLLTPLFILVSVAMWGQSTFSVNGINYEITGSNTVSVVSGGGYTGAITIPASVSYNSEIYSVTAIGTNAFYQCTNLTSISIPSSITSIGNWAFCGCSSLVSVNIPNSVVLINDGAFNHCSGLILVDDNNSTYTSFQGVLYNKSMTTLIQCPTSLEGMLNIPMSVTKIDSYAFQACNNLNTINISASVTSIGDYAFDACSGLINVDSNNSIFLSLNGVLYNKSMSTLIQCPTSIQGTYSIPSSVTTIGKGAFEHCSNLSSIHIPHSVSSIEDWALNGCVALDSIIIDASTPPTLGVINVFGQIDKTTCTLYVHQSSLNAYRTAEQWSSFTHIIEFINSESVDILLGKYYYIQGTRPEKTYITSTGFGMEVKDKALTLGAEQQWRFVVDADGYALQNKQTGEYLNTDLGSGNAAILSTISSIPSRPIHFIKSESDSVLNINRYWVENVINSSNPYVNFRMHAGDSNSGYKLLNWTGNANDNSSWLFVDSLQIKIIEIHSMELKCKSAYNATKNMIGTTYGLYSSSLQVNLSNAIMQTNNTDLNNCTFTQLETLYNNLQNTFNAFISSRVTDINTIISTISNPIYFYVRPSDINTRTVGRSIADVSSRLNASITNVNDDAQKWRFEYANGGAVRMINKLTGSQVSISGESAPGNVYPSITGTSFTLGLHGDGYSTSLGYMYYTTQEYFNTLRDSYDICGWSELNDTASSWVIVPVENGGYTLLSATTNHSNNIHVAGGRITVDKVLDFDVFNELGIRVNSNTVLPKGIYLIHFDNETYKIRIN